jgi:hypothetical protein
MAILEIEGSKEVRFAVRQWYFGPRLSNSYPRRIKLPVRRISSSRKGTPKYCSLARAASSLFIECGKVDRGGPVTFGRRDQVEGLFIKFDDTVVLCG